MDKAQRKALAKLCDTPNVTNRASATGNYGRAATAVDPVGRDAWRELEAQVNCGSTKDVAGAIRKLRKDSRYSRKHDTALLLILLNEVETD